MPGFRTGISKGGEQTNRSEEKTDGVLVPGVSGRAQTETSEELPKKQNTLIDQGGRNLLLDSPHVDCINSSGLRALLVVAKKLGGVTREDGAGKCD